MPARNPGEYDSDSEDEGLDEVETSVLLGLPDGPIESQNDVDDAAVSRIGGYPAFLTGEPPIESAQCKVCSSPMELLVQLWCPFEGSTMDRAMYVFGCSRSGCQKKAGSVRAYRGLRFNKEYAEKLAQKRQREKEKEAAKEAELEAQAKEKAKINPFAMGNTSTSGGLFGGSFATPTGLGNQLFGSSPQEDQHDEEKDEHVDGDDVEEPPASDEESDGDNDSDAHSIVEALTSRLSEASPWSAKQPAFNPPLYLSTSMEYIPPPPKMPKAPSAEEILDEQDQEGKGKKGNDADSWNSATEGYENSLNMDHVFERFATRASYEGEQCIRYELGGTPLPYASDTIFSALFPSPTSNVTQVTGGKFVVTPAVPKRVYDPDSPTIDRCDGCGAKRKFECQLMPNLINVLRASPPTDRKQQPQSDAERKKEVERLLKGGAVDGTGMEWGTCMIFSCEKDCCSSGDGKEANECWREELVLVQWEE